MQGMVTLNSKEQKRERIISQVGRGVTGREAASVLGLSLRQVRRLVSGYRDRGVVALAHGNRGRRPANAMEDESEATGD